MSDIVRSRNYTSDTQVTCAFVCHFTILLHKGELVLSVQARFTHKLT